MATITMATTPERVQYARRAVASLKGQGTIRVYMNGDTAEGIHGADTVWMAPDGDLADLGKFYEPPTSGWHLTVDDDLIYPKTFVADMIAGSDRHLGAITTLHGSVVHTPIASYYRDRTDKQHCLGLVPKNTLVNIPGTGAMCYSTERFHIDASDCPIPYMADIWAGLHAQAQDVPIVVLAHTDTYLRYQSVPNEVTIYAWFSAADRIQTWLINRYPWRVVPLP